MYNIIYDEMMAAKVGEELIIPIYCNNEKNEVKNVEDALCMTKKIDSMNTYPNNVLFTDERECYTNWKKDGHIAPKTTQRKEQRHKNVF